MNTDHASLTYKMKMRSFSPFSQRSSSFMLTFRPYESSVTNPYSTEGREKEIPLRDLNTFFFKVESRSG